MSRWMVYVYMEVLIETTIQEQARPYRWWITPHSVFGGASQLSEMGTVRGGCCAVGNFWS